MVEKKTTKTSKTTKTTEESAAAADAATEDAKTQETGPEPEAGEGRPKRNVEEKLDDFADRFSKSMSEGVRRMEDAFDKGFQSFKDNPNISSGKVKGFFSSSSGGIFLVVVGFAWFFYAVGLFDNPIFPILMIVLGFFLMYKNRS